MVRQPDGRVRVIARRRRGRPARPDARRARPTRGAGTLGTGATATRGEEAAAGPPGPRAVRRSRPYHARAPARGVPACRQPAGRRDDAAIPRFGRRQEECAVTSPIDRAVGALLGLPPVRTRKVRAVRDLVIPADDGVKLLADRYYPVMDESAPLVLIRTPYGRRSANVLIARMFAQRGYQVLMVALRGTDGSGGRFDGFVMNRADGPATVAWLREQDWFPGVFATWGASYLGYAQWDLACTPIPEWKAAILDVAPSDFYHYFMYPGGVFALGNALGWAQLVHSLFRDGRSTNPSTMSAFTATRRLARACDRLPIAEADQDATGARIPYYQDWIMREDYDEFWEQMTYRANVTHLPPVVHMGGDWPDFFLLNQLDDYAELVRAGKTIRLLIGSVAHGQNMRTRTYLRDAFTVLDAALGEYGSAGLESVPPVRLKLTGHPQWRAFTSWPPAHSPSRWYLHGGGRLSTSAAGTSEPSRYRYDPATPTPTAGGTAVGLRAGAKDNRSIEARADVVTFTSAVLDSDLTAIGPVSASIHVRSSVSCFDVFVRVCDVHPRGRSMNVCDGIVRVNGSNGIEPVDVVLWPMGHVFRRGHRIRVQVSSGAHPRFIRNLGTGEPIANAVNPQVAEQEILHDPEHPSALVLPVTD
ncbi:MAG: CocE/NonD family hydrolase [Streptosporangiales bacterium]|nr:CocE/NonD family hydrolase [Streptosporangiales bacterium]